MTSPCRADNLAAVERGAHAGDAERRAVGADPGGAAPIEPPAIGADPIGADPIGADPVGTDPVGAYYSLADRRGAALIYAAATETTKSNEGEFSRHDPPFVRVSLN